MFSGAAELENDTYTYTRTNHQVDQVVVLHFSSIVVFRLVRKNSALPIGLSTRAAYSLWRMMAFTKAAAVCHPAAVQSEHEKLRARWLRTPHLRCPLRLQPKRTVDTTLSSLPCTRVHVLLLLWRSTIMFSLRSRLPYLRQWQWSPV